MGLLLGIITTPIILGYLGEEQFGIFRILIDWFSHLSLLEFGLYGAILSFISKIISEKKGKLGIALQTIFHKYTRVLFWQIGTLLIFAVFYKYIVPVSEANQSNAWWAFGLLSLSTVLIYSQIFRAYLEASQKGYIVNSIIVAQNTVYIVLAVCFVYLSYGVIGQVVAYVISLTFMFAVYLYVCRDTLPLFFSKEMLVQNDLNILKKQRKNLFLNELFGRVSFMSDNIIIVFILGAASVTPFYLTQRLAQILQQQLQSISNSAWPALGELYYKNQKSVLSSRIIQLTELTAAFSGIAMGTLILMNKSFMYIWTGQQTYSGDITTYMSCINGGLVAIVSLWGWCMAAINRSDKAVPVFFTQAMVNVIGSFVLTYAIGINGPLFGTFLGLGVVTAWWLGKIISETFGIKYRVLMFLWTIPFLIPVIVAIAIHRFWRWPLAETWLMFFCQYIGVSLVFLAFVYFLLVSKRTKAVFREKMIEFIRRKI